jgi:hypothetical protein
MEISMTEETVPVSHHYFLIAGVVMFTSAGETAAEDATLGSAPANAIVRHDSTNFPVRKLAKAQLNLHTSFMQKIPAEALPSITVHDIVITNISNIGFMTEEEFQREEAPEPEQEEAAQPVDRI